MYKAAYEVLRSRADAEDAVMDAMCRIVRGEKKFEGLACNDMRALAVIYVRNTAIDIYNKNSARPYPVAELPEIAGTSDSPENAALEADEAGRLTALVQSMPPSYRDVLMLKIRYGMKNGEIAEVLGLEDGTVRTRLSRARKWLDEQANVKSGDFR